MQIEKPLISVIIPVFNVEKYLQICIDSVINQTYHNLEIFLIDDGSTDSSGKICDDYKIKDSRIIVIHKENGGLSDARNVGLNLCSGQYLSFVDSDDFVSPFFIEILYNAMKKNNCDIALLKDSLNFWDCEPINESFASSNNDYDSIYLNSLEALNYMFYQVIPTGAQFKLYRKELFNNLRFPYGFYYEDVATTYKTLLAAKNAVIVDSNVYAYRMRKNSIIRQPFTKKKLSALYIFDQIISDTQLKENDLMDAAKSRCFSMLYSVFLQIPWDNKKEINEAWKRLKSIRFNVLMNNNKNIRIKNKLGALALYFGKTFSYYLGRRFGQKGSMK